MDEPMTNRPQPDEANEAPEAADSQVEQHAEPSGEVAESSAGAAAEPPENQNGEGGAEQPGESGMFWYVLKVQSGREDRIRESLERRVAIDGLEHLFGEIIVPTERVSEIKGGKKRVSERKLYPGYLMIHMVDPTLPENERAWFLVRETPGVGDFTGAGGQPVPMQEHEVERMLGRETSKQEEQPKLKIDFQPGEQVKVKEGTFENFEGSVDSVDEASGRVTVMINIFGRSTPVELEYWQVESV